MSDPAPFGQFDFSVPPTNEATHLARTEARRCFDFADESIEAQLLTALTEIVQNATGAHVDVGTDRHVDVTFFADPPSARVVDSGPGFDWETRRNTRPDPTCPTGRGLLISMAFAPGMTVTTGSSGTTVDLPFDGATWTSDETER